MRYALGTSEQLVQLRVMNTVRTAQTTLLLREVGQA